MRRVEMNEQGMIAESDLMDLLETKIGLYAQLEEEYGTVELENAA